MYLYLHFTFFFNYFGVFSFYLLMNKLDEGSLIIFYFIRRSTRMFDVPDRFQIHLLLSTVDSSVWCRDFDLTYFIVLHVLSLFDNGRRSLAKRHERNLKNILYLMIISILSRFAFQKR